MKKTSCFQEVFQIRWWLERESNPRHEDFQSSALPTELSSRVALRLAARLLYQIQRPLQVKL